MASEVIMPQMGYDMHEGTLVRWLKQEGDQIQRGDLIAEIETDKAVVAMEAHADGVLRKIVVGEGNTTPVGTVIGYIGSADEDIPEPPTSLDQDSVNMKPQMTSPTRQTKQVIGKEKPYESVGSVRASPAARHLANEKRIDIRHVNGTGPGGRITKDDILAYENESNETSLTVEDSATELGIGTTAGSIAHENDTIHETIPLSRMRQAIARRTQKSKQETPHFYISSEIDMTQSMELRQHINQSMKGAVRVSVNDMIVKACTEALPSFPAYNSLYKEDHLQVNPSINIGIAIALEDGLVVPAILRCEQKTLVQIAKESKELTLQAQDGRLSEEQYTSGTFSISNLGMYEVDEFMAIIYPQQSATLAVGTIRQRPVVRNDQVVIRQIMKATLSVDHRVSDGAEAARFLGQIKHLLENPATLLAGTNLSPQ